MSYGRFGLAGTISSSFSSVRSAGSVQARVGGSSMLLAGRNESSSRTPSRHCSSLSNEKWATPLTSLWVWAPPSRSFVTSSWVTARMTSGPVRNM